jgi:hypothetical protein
MTNSLTLQEAILVWAMPKAMSFCHARISLDIHYLGFIFEVRDLYTLLVVAEVAHFMVGGVQNNLPVQCQHNLVYTVLGIAVTWDSNPHFGVSLAA